jgi:hypothetical protein
MVRWEIFELQTIGYEHSKEMSDRISDSYLQEIDTNEMESWKEIAEILPL